MHELPDIVESQIVRDESPAKYWIKFLVSRKKHTVEAIEAMLAAIQLGGEHDDYIRSLMGSMTLPKEFQPMNLKHRPSQNFLRKEGIYDAWHRTSAFEAAFNILGKGELRALIETYILSPLRPHQAVKKIEQKTGDILSEKTYNLFEHYFWNRALLSGAEWGNYIIQRDVAHQEWLQLAVHANGAAGAQMLMWKTGSLAKLHVESGKMFKDIRDISYMCVQQIAHRMPSEGHSKMLLNYTRAATMAQQQLDSSSSAMVDIVEHFNQFKMKRIEVKTPSVMELTRGNFSGAEDQAADTEKLTDY